VFISLETVFAPRGFASMVFAKAGLSVFVLCIREEVTMSVRPASFIALRTALSATLLVAAISSPGAARADDDDATGALRLLHTIPIPASLAPLHGWDIAWLDASTQRLYLADRSN
jgi:hypothetical protein